MIGETINNFKIIHRLGGGGMGEVWAAEQQIIKTRVAIKLLREEMSTNEQHVQRFFNEAIAVDKIKHAGIVKILDVGFYGKRAFLIMEFLEGETLASRIARKGRLPAGDVSEIGRQIVSILEATHAGGIIHRDLKPDNVFLVPDAELANKERVKVLDFGIAKLGIGLTATGETMGTPAYMAPEQWDHTANAGAEADIYSFGCIVFEMCCGRTPFLANSLAEAYTQHHEVLPPRARSLAPELPNDLDNLIARMLAKQPADRPSLSDIGATFSKIVVAQSGTFHLNGTKDTRERHKRIAGIKIATVSGISMLMAGIAIHFVIRGAAPMTMSSENCPKGMIYVSQGTFQIGSPDEEGEADEHPMHTVTISAFCIDETEVTVKAYEACVAAKECSAALLTENSSTHSGEELKQRSRYCNRSDHPNHPMNCVDWDQAVTYCGWIGKRLPTEAEWEYAARGNDGRVYPWGNEAPNVKLLNACGRECVAMAKRDLNLEWKSVYNDSDRWETTAPVGFYPKGKGPFGTLDMAGNVWEWTTDWYHEYPHNALIGTYRVIRGGSWIAGHAHEVSAANRHGLDPSDRLSSVGFRCVRGD